MEKLIYLCSYLVATMKRKPIQMKLEGYEVVEKTAKYSGNGAQIYVPKQWANKKVKVVLIE